VVLAAASALPTLPVPMIEIFVFVPAAVGRAVDGQVSMGALAEQVASTTGGVTRLLDRMIAAGLVERVPCPTDRRVSFAGLAVTGRAKLAEAAPVHAANLRTAFTVFSRDELTVPDDLLDRLREVRLDVPS